MPSFKSAGKSRDDLALVARLAGLVDAEKAEALSRDELVEIIEKENERSMLEESQKTAETRVAAPKARAGKKVRKPATGSGDGELAAQAAGAAALPETMVSSPDKRLAPSDMRPEGVQPRASRGRKKIVTAQPAVAETEPTAPPAKRRGRKKKVDAGVTTVPEVTLPIETAAVSHDVAGADSMDGQPAGETVVAPQTAGTVQAAAAVPRDPERGPTAAGIRARTQAAEPKYQRRTVRSFSPAAGTANAEKGTTGRRGTPRATQGRQNRSYRKTAVEAPANLEADSDLDNLTELIEQNSQELPVADAPATVVSGDAAMAAQAGGYADAAKGRPQVETGDLQAGVLEIMPDGYGFLRKENYLQGNKDIYVPPQYIRRFGLRPGDFVTGLVKLQRESDRYQALLYVKEVNGLSPEKMLKRPHFDRLTPIYPDQRFVLETVRNELSTRIIDLVAPIGKGQRGMIVSPPKAGKTILLQKIANAISTNNPDVKLIVLLIDERPEEVTDMQRSINGEVVYSTFDKTPENHTKVTELVLERAMRLVELKQDVVILLDSMTRLARAYNLSINPTGRTLSGGLDPGALYGPKRFFGAARNIEDGGSLTIIATSLIETGSRMDEVIFEEFKGTGNMEVYLDRKLSEKRIFPAIDINKSGTRREELLMNNKELDAVWTIRKAFSQLDTSAVTEAIINLLLKTKNNEHFISSINVSFNDKNVFEAMRGTRPQDTTQQNRPAPAAGYGNSGYNTTGYNSNYRRPAGYDDD